MKLREAFDTREFGYPSNLLTLSRLVLLPFTLYYLRRPDGRWKALFCIATAMFTDAIDGPIARRRGEVSRLGEILDPIADKLVLDATAFTLSQTRSFPWWVTRLLIFRDVGILLAGLLVLHRRAYITTSKSTGKATTVALTAAAILYTADGPRSGKPALYLALIPFALSFLQYGKEFVKLMWKH